MGAKRDVVVVVSIAECYLLLSLVLQNAITTVLLTSRPVRARLSSLSKHNSDGGCHRMMWLLSLVLQNAVTTDLLTSRPERMTVQPVQARW